jgi:hypothetical protein
VRGMDFEVRVVALVGEESVILGGINSFISTYSMVTTGKSLSRKNLRSRDALEHLIQMPVEAGTYLIW